jgi:hypothetical protein
MSTDGLKGLMNAEVLPDVHGSGWLIEVPNNMCQLLIRNLILADWLVAIRQLANKYCTLVLMGYLFF